MNVLQRLILRDHPDYDFEQYHFRAGDMVKSLDGGLFIVDYSACEYVEAFPLVRTLTYRKKEFQRVYYTDLPYYRKGEFVNSEYPIKDERIVKWEVGDIVCGEYGIVALLFQECGTQEFYGYVLDSDNSYYLHTRIYLPNPNRYYFKSE